MRRAVFICMQVSALLLFGCAGSPALRTSTSRANPSSVIIAAPIGPTLVCYPADPSHFTIAWPDDPRLTNYLWTFQTATNPPGPWMSATQTIQDTNATVWLNGASFIRLIGITNHYDQ